MEEPTNTREQENKKSGVLYLFIILLLLCSNLFICYLLWKEHGKVLVITVEKETVVKDADKVKHELLSLQEDYENIKTTNKKMQKQIDEKKEEIIKMQQELEKHKDDAYIIFKLKKETQTLRDIMQHFVQTIDSLNSFNKKVIAEKNEVKKQLKEAQKKDTILTKEKEELLNTVKIASVLKAVGVKAKSIRIKGKREIETTKAKRTNKIKLTFTLAENKVAAQGEHIIFVRIITPDGKEMSQSTDTTHMFSFGGTRGFWAIKKSVNYSNEDTDVTVYAHAKEGEEFLPGKYIIEVNSDGATIGNTVLELE
ncbi:MAG: hypothetical protein V1781_02190 [Bacteroidota bacterium]